MVAVVWIGSVCGRVGAANWVRARPRRRVAALSVAGGRVTAWRRVACGRIGAGGRLDRELEKLIKITHSKLTAP